VISVPFVKLRSEETPLPAAQTELSAGLDLAAEIGEPLELAPGARKLVPTGLAMALPPGYEAQIRPRSGLALKHGVTVLNSPGTIDADYRGELMVLLINHGQEPFTVTRHMRIAQLVVAPVVTAVASTVAELPPTTRGAGGYGSTGV
jgi:dUTP pyrophosphatase